MDNFQTDLQRGDEVQLMLHETDGPFVATVESFDYTRSGREYVTLRVASHGGQVFVTLDELAAGQWRARRVQ